MAPIIASRAAGSRFGFMVDKAGFDGPSLKLSSNVSLYGGTYSIPSYEVVNFADGGNTLETVTHIDEVKESPSWDALSDGDFFARYKLTSHRYQNPTDIWSYCRKDGNILSQSSFYTTNAITVGSVTKVISRSNDDNDVLHMMMHNPGASNGQTSGYGVQGDGNYNYWNSSNTYGQFVGSVQIHNDGSNIAQNGYRLFGTVEDAVTPNANTNYAGVVIPFVRTGVNMGINNQTLNYQIGDGNVYSLPNSTAAEQSFRTAMTNSGTTKVNNEFVMVDGINSFVYQYHARGGFYVTLDLYTRQIRSVEQLWSGTTLGSGFGRYQNGTEQDPNATILHPINARPSYFGSSYFRYSTPNASGHTGWLHQMTNTTAMTNSSVYGNQWPSFGSEQNTNTQTGMDIIVSCSPLYGVWFGDHGHDNGGLFGVGNDNGVGTAKANNLTLNYFS